MGRTRIIATTVAIMLASAWIATAENEGPQPQGYELIAPLGIDLDQLRVPEDDPITQAKAVLGITLFFDARLSGDGTVSCATCHHPEKGFSDQLPVSKGIRGQSGTRNAPTVLNSGFNELQFREGRAATLEEVAARHIENPVEMGNTHEKAVATIAAIGEYVDDFARAFGDGEVTIDRIAKALAAYQRTLLSGKSRWDQHLNGKPGAMSESAVRGLALFEGKANCTRCHVGSLLTDGQFHNLGVGMDTGKPDLGRYEVTKDEADKGAFKTPGLRDLLRTAPYMHDGSIATLEEVVELYDRGGEKNPWLDEKLVPLELSDQEKADLVAFLGSLEGDWRAPIPTEFPK